MLSRAYSLFEIKAVDEDQRIISGIATTPSPDRMGDVVKPEGATYKLPIPFLWQHDSGQPLGHVVDAKVTKAGIEIKAQIASGVTDRIEEAWKLIKAGLVRGLSIGFRGIDVDQIPNSWGVIFNSWEWLELSAVTIPANGEATITAIKSIDHELMAASGRPELRGERRDDPGVSGTTRTTHPVVSTRDSRNTKMDIAEQIKSFEETRATKAARMDEIMEAAAKKGETLDAEQSEEYDGLEAELKSIDKHIERLKSAEQYKAKQAKAVEKAAGTSGQAAADARTPSLQVKRQPKLEPGINFARLARVKALAKLDGESAREMAKGLYGENSQVYGFLSKAAVAAGTSSDTTWAGNLIGDETSMFADFVEYLRPRTILGRFGTDGIPSLRRVPFRVALVGQTSGGSGYWVGEGKPKPLTKFDFSRTTLEPLKVANIAVVSEEVLRDSSPSAEVIVRDQLAAALRERLDTDFIDPTKSASAGVSPASITNGITPIPSSGTDADAVRADVQAVFNAFISANNPPTSGVWIMSASTALALSLMVSTLSQPEFPGISMMGGTFFGLPVITSEYVPSDSNGYTVVLANAQDIYMADEGGIMVDMSREASLQMDDAPGTQDATTGTGTSLVSLWQTNSVGFRAERTISWARRRSSAVAVLDNVNWGV